MFPGRTKLKKPAFRTLAPALAISALLLVSFLVPSRGTFHFDPRLVACAGYGTGFGYVGGPPTVTDVNPSLGPTAGGTIVTITGKGYCGSTTATTSVKFGATSATFTVNSDTSMMATSPAASATGVVDVTVTNSFGTSAINAGDRFAYMKTGGAAGGGLYTLDGFGGFNPDDSPGIVTRSYWVGWRIARAAHAWPTAPGSSQQGFTLDGYGGMHPYGPATPTISETSGSAGHYWGFDIARDFAFMPDGSGGVLLDGYGGLHPFGVNGGVGPTVSGYSYFGFDVAIKVVIAADGKGGFTLDAYGGVHPFSLNGNPAPAAVQNTGYWSWRAAVDIALISSGGGYAGYVLDRFGGLHPFIAVGSTLPPQPMTSYPGFDIMRGVLFLTGSSTDGYTLDGYGGPHPFGNAPILHSYGYWGGWDIAIQIFGI